MTVSSVLLADTRPAARWLREGARWLEHIDPGARRRIRGLRLAAVFAIASMAGLLAVPGPHSVGAACAATFAIWPSVYENAATRRQAMIDLLVMIASSALGASSSAIWTTIVGSTVPVVWLLPLVPGAFFVDYAKRYGTLGIGIGSTAFIGQLIGFGLAL